MELDKNYDLLRITNGFFRGYDSETKAYGTAKSTGCTGSLSMEPETRTVVKRCEREVTEERVIITGMVVTFAGR